MSAKAWQGNREIRAATGLVTAIVLLALALMSALALGLASPPTAEAHSRFEVKGRWSCNNRGTTIPLQRARVELWRAIDYWWDDRIGATHTDSNGRFSFQVRASDHVRLYSALVLTDNQGVRLENWYEFSPWSIDGPSKGTHASVVDLGSRVIHRNNGAGTPKCAMWQGARNAYRNHMSVMGGARPPSANYLINADFPFVPTPFTTLDTTNWPSGFRTGSAGDAQNGFTTSFHEFAHSVRHTFDGNFAHFLVDVAQFGYTRTHSSCDKTNQGFAFNEGWAEFWAKRFNTCPQTPNDFEQEGNVAGGLTQLEACVGRARMVRTLQNNRGNIHSFAQFQSRLGVSIPCVAPPVATQSATPGDAGGDATPFTRTQRTADLRGQVTATTGLITRLRRQLGGVDRTARRAPGCTGLGCLNVAEILGQPSALRARIAQAQLVESKLRRTLLLAPRSDFDPGLQRASFYSQLTGDKRAFEQANQDILIRHLTQALGAITPRIGGNRIGFSQRAGQLRSALSLLRNLRRRGAIPPRRFATPTLPTEGTAAGPS